MSQESLDQLKAERRDAAERSRFEARLITDGTRYVFVQPIRCPSCNGSDHQTQRTERNDGVKSQRKTCRSCGHKFIAVFQDLES